MTGVLFKTTRLGKRKAIESSLDNSSAVEPAFKKRSARTVDAPSTPISQSQASSHQDMDSGDDSMSESMSQGEEDFDDGTQDSEVGSLDGKPH